MLEKSTAATFGLVMLAYGLHAWIGVSFLLAGLLTTILLVMCAVGLVASFSGLADDVDKPEPKDDRLEQGDIEFRCF